MNWWLAILLSLWVINNIYSITKRKEIHKMVGYLIGTSIFWFFVYMSGIFTLL